jgi:hypothetical protein
MSTKRQYTYAIGDRVAERPKSHGLFAIRQETKERIAQYSTQRYGTVIALNFKKDKRGNNQRFLLIKWDHLKTPTEHAQMRICPEEQLAKLQAEGYGCEVE